MQPLTRFVLRSALTSVFTLVSLALPAIATPGQWVRILTDSYGDTWYVDAGSIEGRNAYRYFWSYVLYQTPVSHDNGLAYSAAYYLSVDCPKQLWRVRYVRFLDQKNQTVSEYEPGENGRLGDSSIVSEGGAASLKFVCSRRRS
ncbi:MAG: hypothetical protein KME16_12245 [Scytolyngbya sp. HA4215-MV1]|jgi:hypothetical protein|nr:hypothetical protein [Scytolyngbya sp. HA4215-MV1]